MIYKKIKTNYYEFVKSKLNKKHETNNESSDIHKIDYGDYIGVFIFSPLLYPFIFLIEFFDHIKKSVEKKAKVDFVKEKQKEIYAQIGEAHLSGKPTDDLLNELEKINEL